MTRRFLITSILILAIATCFVAFLAHRSLSRSYHGNIIRQVVDTCVLFVRNTGEWPESWSDLHNTDPAVDWIAAENICGIKFSITCSDVAKQSIEHFNAIYPKRVSYKPDSSIEALITECMRQTK